MSEQDIAIVTGGSRGIGRAICIELATHGYYVIINYKSNEEAALQTLEMIKSNSMLLIMRKVKNV
jgi:3-oxoacyl-[acyl-carrier protein] reductase